MFPYSTITCTYMCEDTYNVSDDLDACTKGCNATANSPLYTPISVDFISVLVMMDSLANQAYDIFLLLPSTTSEIDAIAVFTSEEGFSQWQVTQYTDHAGQIKTGDGAPLSDTYYTCSGRHASLIHIAIGSLFLLLIVLMISCCTAMMDIAPRVKKPYTCVMENPPLHLPQKITPIVLPVSLKSDKLIKNSAIVL